MPKTNGNGCYRCSSQCDECRPEAYGPCGDEDRHHDSLCGDACIMRQQFPTLDTLNGFEVIKGIRVHVR
jgi:hypothetical protein